jgi:hypothetical protein
VNPGILHFVLVSCTRPGRGNGPFQVLRWLDGPKLALVPGPKGSTFVYSARRVPWKGSARSLVEVWDRLGGPAAAEALSRAREQGCDVEAIAARLQDEKRAARSAKRVRA